MPNPFSAPEKAEQRLQAMKLWMSGAPYRAIGQALGVSHQTAYERVQQAIDEMRPHADYDRYRSVQLAELEISRQQLRRVIVGWTAGQDPAHMVAAISALLRLQDHEAKLLGLHRVPNPADELMKMSDADLAAIVHSWSTDVLDDRPTFGPERPDPDPA